MSEKLDTELRSKAADLGVSVSNLVRNILLNTVELVEDLVADSSRIAKASAGDHSERSVNTPSAQKASPILGWQMLTLNLNALCASCNAVLPKGGQAAMAVYASPGTTIPSFRCLSCAEPKPSEASEDSP